MTTSLQKHGKTRSSTKLNTPVSSSLCGAEVRPWALRRTTTCHVLQRRRPRPLPSQAGRSTHGTSRTELRIQLRATTRKVACRLGSARQLSLSEVFRFLEVFSHVFCRIYEQAKSSLMGLGHVKTNSCFQGAMLERNGCERLWESWATASAKAE